MRISISVIALGVISIACNNLQVNAGSFRLPSEDGIRMVTRLSVAPSKEGLYIVEETYNTGSIRKYNVLSNSSIQEKRKYFFGIKEIAIDDADGSESKTFFNPFCVHQPKYTVFGQTKHRNGEVSDFVGALPFEGLPLKSLVLGSAVNDGSDSEDEGTETRIVNPGFSNTASSMSDIDGDTEGEGTVTRIVNPGFSNTSSASNMGDNDSGIDKEEIEKAWAEEMVSSIPSTALILKPRMTLSSFVKQTSLASEADASLSKGKEKKHPKITVRSLENAAKSDKKEIMLGSSNSRALSIFKSKILEARGPSNPPSVFRAWRDRRADIKEVGRGYYTKYYYPIYTKNYYPMKGRSSPEIVSTETDLAQKAAAPAQKDVPSKHRWFSSLVGLKRN
ncbi:MAG: hypothetical protein BGO67_03365 [Alphaproteobacteria bacterium 41-28]|nr:MAG: hypothetical protein BGO67_03365 [Alphaproteobacteria bacterium 41-28]